MVMVWPAGMCSTYYYYPGNCGVGRTEGLDIGTGWGTMLPNPRETTCTATATHLCLPPCTGLFYCIYMSLY